MPYDVAQDVAYFTSRCLRNLSLVSLRPENLRSMMYWILPGFSTTPMEDNHSPGVLGCCCLLGNLSKFALRVVGWICGYPTAVKLQDLPPVSALLGTPSVTTFTNKPMFENPSAPPYHSRTRAKTLARSHVLETALVSQKERETLLHTIFR